MPNLVSHKASFPSKFIITQAYMLSHDSLIIPPVSSLTPHHHISLLIFTFISKSYAAETKESTSQFTFSQNHNHSIIHHLILSLSQNLQPTFSTQALQLTQAHKTFQKSKIHLRTTLKTQQRENLIKTQGFKNSISH